MDKRKGPRGTDNAQADMEVSHSFKMILSKGSLVTPEEIKAGVHVGYDTQMGWANKDYWLKLRLVDDGVFLEGGLPKRIAADMDELRTKRDSGMLRSIKLLEEYE